MITGPLHRWELLVLTQPSRKDFLERLYAVLRPQLEESPDVKFTTRTYDTALDLGTNRQAMREQSTALYSSFIDDDDLVPANFISTIYPLLDGVDYIGFQLQMYLDGEKQKPTFHSLRYKTWNGDQEGWYRDISHVNPILNKIALAMPMSGGFGEDSRWSEGLRNLGIVKTEHYVDSIMYFYYYRSNKIDHVTPANQVRTSYNPQNVIGQRPPTCPECGNTATTLAGGMRHCNQCSARWM